VRNSHGKACGKTKEESRINIMLAAGAQLTTGARDLFFLGAYCRDETTGTR
jgi:hypothetical protein